MKRRPVVGIILSAGKGTRMANLALPFSKTLLTVLNMPVVAYPARALAPLVDELVLVTNPLTSEAILSAVKDNILNNSENIKTVIQPKPLGVADAIAVGISALKTDSTIVIICGDNIIIENQNISTILECVLADNGACADVNLAWTYREFETSQAKQFAVWNPLSSKHGLLIEKPAHPPSRICWCGPIAFRSSDDVKRRISGLTLSARNEYEATELMNSYITNGEARRFLLTGLWFDIGNERALKEAYDMLAQQSENFNK